MIIDWLIINLLPSLGFVFALFLLSHILRERRSPTSTLAWLMGIVFIPYVGVPLYLILGGRKMMRKADTKPALPGYASLSACEHQETACPFDPANGWYPVTSNNRIALLSKGDQAFHEIISLIEGAKRSIFITTFLIGNDETGRRIVAALSRKASQGVNVCLLLDAMGSAKIRRRFFKSLEKAGGRVAFFMPMLHLPFRGRANLRNHRKMVIVDEKRAVIGGMNLATEYMGPQASQNRWKDLSLLIDGAATAHLTEIFRADWRFASKEDLPAGPSFGPAPEPFSNAKMQLVASGPDVSNDSLRNAIITAIFRANRRVWIVTPYFVPDELFLEALCIAAARQIDVSLIAPQKSNHRFADLVREGYLTRLQESGVDVRLYTPNMLHAKAVLVDESLAIVGSANMDMRSLLLNYEIAMLIYDTGTIRQVDAWMQELKTDCTIREPRPKSMRDLIEGVGRLFAPLL